MNRASQSIPSGAAVGLCGICSGCGLTRRLHSDGQAVYRHGPHNKPCPGSGKPPTVTIDPSQPPSSTAGVANGSLPGISSQDPAAATIDGPPDASFQHRSPLPHVTSAGPSIKHIHRAARAACVIRLTELLDGVLDDPGNESQWLSLLGFGGDVLSKPTRGGKRRSLATQIKKRCASQQEDDPKRPESSRMGHRKTCPDSSNGNRAEEPPPKLLSYYF